MRAPHSHTHTHTHTRTHTHGNSRFGRLRTIDRFRNLSDDEGFNLLRSFQDLDLCVELGEAALKTYGVQGFLFPSLRPTGEHYLLHPHFAASLMRETVRDRTVRAKNSLTSRRIRSRWRGVCTCHAASRCRRRAIWRRHTFTYRSAPYAVSVTVCLWVSGGFVYMFVLCCVCTLGRYAQVCSCG